MKRQRKIYNLVTRSLLFLALCPSTSLTYGGATRQNDGGSSDLVPGARWRVEFSAIFQPPHPLPPRFIDGDEIKLVSFFCAFVPNIISIITSVLLPFRSPFHLSPFFYFSRSAEPSAGPDKRWKGSAEATASNNDQQAMVRRLGWPLPLAVRRWIFIWYWFKG